MELVDETQDSFSEAQDKELREKIIEDFHDNFHRQMVTINIYEESDDLIAKLLKDYFNYILLDDLESRQIYVDPIMQSDQTNREDLFNICSMINNIFETSWGIRLRDEDIYYLYSLYTVLILKFSEYFVYFVNGLQKLNEEFVEDLPNYNEYTFNYFIHNVSSIKKENLEKNENLKIPIIKEYVNYIIELGIKTELYFEICLQESEGNVMLSYLYSESVNGNISYDEEFFNMKIQKLLELPESEPIFSRLADFI